MRDDPTPPADIPAARHDPVGALVRAGTLDAELAGLLAILVGARIPAVVVSPDPRAAAVVADALETLLPADARTAAVAPDDDFDWLPEAVELGWRRDRTALAGGVGERPARRVAPSDGVLIVQGLGVGEDDAAAWRPGVGGERARIVVRALALGYGLVATMPGGGLDEALDRLHGPAVGTDPDERARLGIVLAVADDAGTPRVTAAHYVRPVALDSHGHVQRLPPAVLATRNAAGRWDHFAWGLAPELAGRLGIRPIELEREQARRAADLA